MESRSSEARGSQCHDLAQNRCCSSARMGFASVARGYMSMLGARCGFKHRHSFCQSDRAGHASVVLAPMSMLGTL
eukprot:4777731-Alexandrium_andersonii.AAC.1